MNTHERYSTSSEPNLPETTGIPSAENERVTAQELTKALERIEAGKEEESRRLNNTIALGEAVRELSLGVSPEEIFAEVQRQRRLGQTTLSEQLPHVALPGPSDIAEVWPPAPGPQNVVSEAARAEITHCPACSRKLLTQTSAMCNWCGAIINNPDYQAQAAEVRQIRDQNERQQVESVVQEEARYGVFGRLKRLAKQPGKPPTLS